MSRYARRFSRRDPVAARGPFAWRSAEGPLPADLRQTQRTVEEGAYDAREGTSLERVVAHPSGGHYLMVATLEGWRYSVAVPQ